MSNKIEDEKMLELLADQAVFGLSEKELRELERLENEYPNLSLDPTFEVAAAAVGLSKIDSSEHMPASLQSKILADADEFFGAAQVVNEEPRKHEVVEPVTETVESNVRTVEFDEPKRPFWQWLTPVFAGIGCLALIANIWITYSGQQEVAVQKKDPVESPKVLTSSEKRDQFIASAKDVIRTSWTSPAKDENLKGEVVWSTEKQEGYMTFKGLPKNAADKETYQLWIFDETPLEAHPVDGGVFDINADGEVVVPIDAKIRTGAPKAFAVTVEKPGGVVVSKREKIVALATT